MGKVNDVRQINQIRAVNVDKATTASTVKAEFHYEKQHDLGPANETYVFLLGQSKDVFSTEVLCRQS